MQMLLVIKGTKQETITAAQKHGIPFRPGRYDFENNECIGLVSEDYRNKATEWYEDYSLSIDSPGTLLSIIDA